MRLARKWKVAPCIHFGTYRGDNSAAASLKSRDGELSSTPRPAKLSVQDPPDVTSAIIHIILIWENFAPQRNLRVANNYYNWRPNSNG
jgi:hypothetical protein